MVGDLFDDGHLALELEECLNGISDIERVFGKISMGTAEPRDLIRLKNSISPIFKIFKLINETKTESPSGPRRGV